MAVSFTNNNKMLKKAIAYFRDKKRKAYFIRIMRRNDGDALVKLFQMFITNYIVKKENNNPNVETI